MKPQNLPEDGSFFHESKRRLGEMLKEVRENTIVAMTAKPKSYNRLGRVSVSQEMERRNKRSGTEDPMRTIMFLGSWSHS